MCAYAYSSSEEYCLKLSVSSTLPQEGKLFWGESIFIAAISIPSLEMTPTFIIPFDYGPSS